MTAQIHENLILNGEETTLACCPALPLDDPRIILRTRQEIEGDDRDPILQSTACWRRYLGTWEIKKGQLYLVDLKGDFRLAESKPILADWYSGILRVPQGEILHYVHMGFETVYEEDLLIKVENGVVIGTRIIDNRK